jgi:C_GCAxxG_C_C family probable redox protein
VTKSEHAAEQLESGLNCAQSVLGEFAEELGLDLDMAYRVACGFGGGIGGTGDKCGAVTGSVIVLGLAACGPDPRTRSSRVLMDRQVQSFVERFEAKLGTTLCRDLLGCDIRTPEGLAEAATLDLFKTRCPQYVKDAVEILEEMLPG